jgi:hypothetical protein
MRFLASFAMRGRSQAVMSAVVLAMVSLLVPPLSVLSSAIIALVTLRRGQVEGLVVAGLAGLASGLLAYLAFASPAPALGFVLLWLPVLVVALVLRITRSLPWMVEAALAVGLLVIGVIYLQVSDPSIAWREALEPFGQDLADAGFLDEGQRDMFIEQLARWMTGFFAASFFLLLVLSVIVARWWQSALYNPGGFRQEFHALRLHRALGFAGLLLLGLLLAGFGGEGGLILDLSLLLSSALLLQGLAVAHGVSALRKAHPAWLVAMYVLWFFAMPQVSMLLVAIGLADLWFDFRARVKTPGDRLNS